MTIYTVYFTPSNSIGAYSLAACVINSLASDTQCRAGQAVSKSVLSLDDDTRSFNTLGMASRLCGSVAFIPLCMDSPCTASTW
jgi:hypothetical protein